MLLDRVSGWMTPERLRVYPRMILVLTLVGFVLSQWLGPGLLDAGGTVVGADFLAFYVGARLWLSGAPDVYDLDVQHALANFFVGVDTHHVDAFLHPPTALPLLAPFALLPYLPALGIWTLVNLGALAGAVAIGAGGLSLPGPKSAWATRALLFFPTLSFLLYGQMTGILILVFTYAAIALRERHEGKAGAVAALLVIKPHLLAGWLLLGLAQRRWRFLLATVGWILGWTVLLGGLAADQWLPFATHLSSFTDVLRDPTYPAWGMANAFGFWLLLLGPAHGTTVGALSIASSVTLWALVGIGWSRTLWTPGQRVSDLRLAAGLAATLVASPHLYQYDLALMLLPLALVARHEWTADGPQPGPMLRVTAWLGLACFAGPYVTAAMAAVTEKWVGGRWAFEVTGPVVLWWAWTAWRQAGGPERPEAVANA